MVEWNSPPYTERVDKNTDWVLFVFYFGTNIFASYGQHWYIYISYLSDGMLSIITQKSGVSDD